jgi:hypothetical protein
MNEVSCPKVRHPSTYTSVEGVRGGDGRSDLPSAVSAG